MKNDRAGKFFFWLFLVYAFFVVYGSLVPFKFQYISPELALRRFVDLRFTPLKMISRMDWTTNILLGIPVSFLGLCWLGRPGRIWKWILISGGMLTFCLALATTAEFLQIFFSSRVASINDVAAQMIGACAGICLGIMFAGPLQRSINLFLATRKQDRRLDFLFSAYVLFLFILNIMPLDLSLSPVDIYRKWTHGTINLIPFAFRTDSPLTFIYNTVVDTIKWAPISFFWVYTNRFRMAEAILATLGIAAGIEFAQIFVMSRITDITDLITALAGAGLGAFLAAGGRGRKFEPPQSTRSLYSGLLMDGALFGSWLLLLVIIDWFPFDFVVNKHAIKHQLDHLSLIPFVNYQANNIYHAIATAARKLIWFIPAGMIVAHRTTGGRGSSSRTVNRILAGIYGIFIVGTSILLEVGQFFLPRKIPDVTDILLEVSGAVIGYWSLRQVYVLREDKA